MKLLLDQMYGAGPAEALRAAGGHHSGVLIALSSRLSRRPAGTGPLVAAVGALVHERLDDRVVHLGRRD